MKPCPNCGAELSDTYCARCGQKDVDLERPIWRLVGDLLEETFDVDGRALRTLRALLLQPGMLTSEFLAGRRRYYTPPLRLYLVISVSFFLFAAWLANQGLLLEPGQSVEEDAAGQARFVAEALPRLMFVLLPGFALLAKIAVFRRLYFDHLIFAIHVHAAVYVLLAVALPMEHLSNWVAIAVQLALYAYLVVYLAMAVRRVYEKGWLASWAISLALQLAYLMLISAVIEGTSTLQIVSD